MEKEDPVQVTEKEWPERQAENQENVLSRKSKEECSLSKDRDYHLYQMLIRVSKMWTGKGPLDLTTSGSLIKAVLVELCIQKPEWVENGKRSEEIEMSFSSFTKGEQKKLGQLLNEDGDYG